LMKFKTKCRKVSTNQLMNQSTMLSFLISDFLEFAFADLNNDFFVKNDILVSGDLLSVNLYSTLFKKAPCLVPAGHKAGGKEYIYKPRFFLVRYELFHVFRIVLAREYAVKLNARRDRCFSAVVAAGDLFSEVSLCFPGVLVFNVFKSLSVSNS